MTLLSLTGVSRTYGEVLALDRVDLSVKVGGLTAVVGASGSGKTTLLRLIAGFEAPDAGRIEMGGTVLAGGSGFVPAHRRGIGLVAQEGALFPHLSAGANIAFGMEGSEQDRRVAELLRAVELDPALAQRMPHELSGGQQQRVALARALARRPRLMLFDEPFSALDAGLRANMREMVKARLGAEGITGILVTHDQQEALSFADQLVVLEDGRIVQAGDPRELYQQPRTERLARFLGDALVVDAAVAGGEAMTALGRVRVGKATAEGRARILLRPEQIRLVPWSEGQPAAEILSASFEGPITVVKFRANGATFTIKCSSAEAPVQGRASIIVLGTGHPVAAA
ncbi:ABC transporter ATP-binding protein [Devosia sp.]|uniref:ABC transporter ATP-binding protein n=1 Tax=Devosia sp. TaxID=1871048 RepID=UPI001AC4583B|nr:ABC transporter ATP-binding protein [Devosia sp.]MBN9309994.1 ABC transporter ATP-binding protein [Devosia sp.]